MTYTFDEHRHRFAAWTAGRAANVKGCRFPVAQAKLILEAAGLQRLLSGPESLPMPAAVDKEHEIWRENVILEAKKIELRFSHGVAAKLINIYLKTGVVFAGYHSDERVRALHPPIDSLLLQELGDKDVGGLREYWGKVRAIRWSKFNSTQYQDIIDKIRISMPNHALWEVEQYWPGHQ